MKPDIFTLSMGQVAAFKLAAQERGRYALECAHAEPEGLVLTDGRKLVVLPYTLPEHAPKQPVLLHRRFLQTVSRWLKRKLRGRWWPFAHEGGCDRDEHAKCRVWKHRAHAIIESSKFERVFTIQEENEANGVFPDWRKVMPDGPVLAEFPFDPEYMRQVIEALEPFTGKTAQCVMMRVHGNGFRKDKPNEREPATATFVTATGAFGLLMPVDDSPTGFPLPKFVRPA